MMYPYRLGMPVMMQPPYLWGWLAMLPQREWNQMKCEQVWRWRVMATCLHIHRR
jgi:hypothetical protein